MKRSEALTWVVDAGTGFGHRLRKSRGLVESSDDLDELLLEEWTRQQQAELEWSAVHRVMTPAETQALWVWAVRKAFLSP